MQRPNLTATVLSAPPCPYLEPRADHCLAAVAGHHPAAERRGVRCHSDDHDGCPRFMARLLRSSPREHAGPMRDLAAK